MTDFENEIAPEKMEAMMQHGYKLAGWRHQLGKLAIKCVKCKTPQVQLLNVECQWWKCRHCGEKFFTAHILIED